MDRGTPVKSHGDVDMVVGDLIGRIFGRGRRRRFRRYSKLQDRSCNADSGCVHLPTIENLEGRYDSAHEDEDELTALQPQRPRSSFSSGDDSSRRWTSSADQYCHRRRRGFYCMRLRIVNTARVVAIMRKVRLAYRRMMSAAAASKTILSLADLYNDIADLIPVPCSGNNAARTIVLIRPVKSPSGLSDDDEGEELVGVPSDQVFSSSSSKTSMCSIARGPDAGKDCVSTAGPAKAIVNHNPSSWRKFIFPSFSCICASSISSWTSPL